MQTAFCITTRHIGLPQRDFGESGKKWQNKSFLFTISGKQAPSFSGLRLPHFFFSWFGLFSLWFLSFGLLFFVRWVLVIFIFIFFCDSVSNFSSNPSFLSIFFYCFTFNFFLWHLFTFLNYTFHLFFPIPYSNLLSFFLCSFRYWFVVRTPNYKR